MKLDKLKEIFLSLACLLLLVLLANYIHLSELLKKIWCLMVPILIGFAYAWFTHPLIIKFDKKIKRGLSCLLLFLVICGSVLIFMYFLIPTIYKEIQELVDLLPAFLNLIKDNCVKNGIWDYVSSFFSNLGQGIPNYLVCWIKNVFSLLGIIGIGMLLGFYFSLSYEKIIETICSLLPHKKKVECLNFLHDSSDLVRRSFMGTLLVAFMVFMEDTILFMILGVDVPLLLGVLCGITDLIPYIGPYIGGGVAVLVAFTESKSLGWWCLIACVAVQTIENYILQPFIMSKSIKVSPALVLIGIFVLGNLFGIMGMLLATPCVAIIKLLIGAVKKKDENDSLQNALQDIEKSL